MFHCTLPRLVSLYDIMPYIGLHSDVQLTAVLSNNRVQSVATRKRCGVFEPDTALTAPASLRTDQATFVTIVVSFIMSEFALMKLFRDALISVG